MTQSSGPDEGYYDLGAYSRPIMTTSAAAQTWFTRGLIWSYGFHHEEAAACFENAISHDPSCAMAYWGLAYSLGPNYNKPWHFFSSSEIHSTVTRTHRAVEQAKEHSSNASAAEQGLISALQHRYPGENGAADFSIWNTSYADAMRDVYAKNPGDLDIAALTADALMNLTPWDLWDIQTGSPAPGAATLEIKSILDAALSLPGGLSHPGLLHLYIHFVEMSPDPSIGLPVANHLRGLVPDSGHLNHMPTHLDILCGDYSTAMIWNERATQADEKYLRRSGPINFYTLYRCHNYHFRIYAAMFAGNYSVAIHTVNALEASLPSDLLRTTNPTMADWLESFGSVRVHVLVRFGRWHDLIALPPPTDVDLYCVTTAFTHYGRALAFAALNCLAEADAEQSLFLTATARVASIGKDRTLFNNSASALLKIAQTMLAGEVAYRKGRFDDAFAHLRDAVCLDDALPYDEPWGWMQPTRHAYGALLLEQGHVVEAEAVYKADLGWDGDASVPRQLRHERNVWALAGLDECFTKLGRSERDRRKVRQLLDQVRREADVEVRVSCFCRTGTIIGLPGPEAKF
ncbi:hypothetical protein DV737_g5023, partial [Chaetothyriales sp. CBS 132003]